MNAINANLTAVNREYKDTMFQMLFSEKRELLSLYNAMNHSDYTDPEDLTITTLKDAMFLSMKNDISFVFQSQLFLYEHQSTVNPNMPLRDLFYVARQLRGMVPGRKIYGSSLVRIPEPRFVVFYNGTAEQEDYIEYRLSALYQKRSDEPALDLKVQVYNVNAGHNQELMTACRTLQEYAQFVQVIREHIESVEIRDPDDEDAVREAIRGAVIAGIKYCIQNNILREFLMKHEAEAVEMSFDEYFSNLFVEGVREEGRAEGRAQGREEERANTEREKSRADTAEQENRKLKEVIAELEKKLEEQK